MIDSRQEKTASNAFGVNADTTETIKKVIGSEYSRN